MPAAPRRSSEKTDFRIPMAVNLARFAGKGAEKEAARKRAWAGESACPTLVRDLPHHQDRAFVGFERDFQGSLPAIGLPAPEVADFARARQSYGNLRRRVVPVEDAQQRAVLQLHGADGEAFVVELGGDPADRTEMLKKLLPPGRQPR